MPRIDTLLESLEGTELYSSIVALGSAPIPVTADELLNFSGELTQEIREDLHDIAKIPQSAADQVDAVPNLAYVLVAISTLSKKKVGLTIQTDGKIDINEPPSALTCTRKRCKNHVRMEQRQSSDGGCCEVLKTDLGADFTAKFEELATLQRSDFAPNVPLTTWAFVNPRTLTVFMRTKEKDR